MKRNLSATFKESGNLESSLLNSSQPTPPPSPRGKQKLTRVEGTPETMINNQLSNLHLQPGNFILPLFSRQPLSNDVEKISNHITELQLSPNQPRLRKSRNRDKKD